MTLRAAFPTSEPAVGRVPESVVLPPAIEPPLELVPAAPRPPLRPPIVAPIASPVAAPVMPPPGHPLRQTISLKSHLTGLAQVVWLQRASGRDNIVIEVTPGGRYDPALATVLALEPIVLQIAGGLHARDFERVATWATANRDLIDDFWDSQIDAFEEIMARVKKVPAPGWR